MAALLDWSSIYLKHAHSRLKKQIRGFDLTIEDVYDMQNMCAYEVISTAAMFSCRP